MIDMSRREQGGNEKFVGRDLEAIVLSMLREQPMCGYDIIKAIFQRYDVVVSQGRIYPLLYSLESRSVLRCEIKSDARAKVYSISEKGAR